MTLKVVKYMHVYQDLGRDNRQMLATAHKHTFQRPGLVPQMLYITHSTPMAMSLIPEGSFQVKEWSLFGISVYFIHVYSTSNMTR